MKPLHTERLAWMLPAFLHAVGAVGIASGYGSFFLGLTALNLLVCGGAVLWAARKNGSWHWGLGAAAGYLSEVVGVNTGLLYGNYAYGEGLGWQWAGVPLLLGLLWLLMLEGGAAWAVRLGARDRWSIAAVGASLMTAVDGLLEPVAIQAGWWMWDGGSPPWTNYASWWGVAFVLLLFRPAALHRHPEAVSPAPARLFLIFALFFCLLNLFPWTL